MLRLSRILQPVFALSIPWTAIAETSPLSEMSVETRLRYEDIQSDNGPFSGDNATFRVNVSNEANLHKNLNVLGELQAGLHIFNNVSFIAPPSSEIANNNFIQVNRLQAQFEISPELNLTVGRQYLTQMNERLLGALRFLDNDQTFDAVRLNYVDKNGLTVNLSYANRVLRQGGRVDPEMDFSGDIWNVAASTPTPIGTLCLHHQNIEGDKPLQRLAGLSHAQTTILNLSGRSHTDNTNLLWSLSYGQQDQSGALSANDLEYFDAKASLSVEKLTLSAQYENLGANSAGSAFQTPLGTNHAFQGKADLFLKTPDLGLIDTNLNIKYSFGTVGEFKKISGTLSYHDFKADTGPQTLGSEWDFTLQSVIRGTLIKFEYANYDAASFGTDRSFVWLTLGKKY